MRHCSSLQTRSERDATTSPVWRWSLVTLSIAAAGAVLIANCTLLSGPSTAPAPTPTETPTPSPTASPTPEPTPAPSGDEAAAAASEAERKARQAAKLAAEAAAAARDAARAAARAVVASKAHGSPSRHSAPKESPQSSPSPTPAPIEASSPASEPSAAATITLTGTPPEQYQKEIDQLADQMKNIDRGKLDDDNAQRYDIASGLLTSARSSLAKNDYMAAKSLTQKAKVVVETIAH